MKWSHGLILGREVESKIFPLAVVWPHVIDVMWKGRCVCVGVAPPDLD